MDLFRNLCVHFYCSERRLGHVTEELLSSTFALHSYFVLNSAGRAHASVSHSRGGGQGGATRLHRPGGARRGRGPGGHMGAEAREGQVRPPVALTAGIHANRGRHRLPSGMGRSLDWLRWEPVGGGIPQEGAWIAFLSPPPRPLFVDSIATLRNWFSWGQLTGPLPPFCRSPAVAAVPTSRFGRRSLLGLQESLRSSCSPGSWRGYVAPWRPPWNLNPTPRLSPRRRPQQPGHL